ncbi:hypothetical protein Poli38472_012664 [Pythium oligandrum]|uniref:Uncharacterized protein n=1 Tax=Pythium oligandrum TaxID=41045 RepID=A0A8K1CED2_PYTOL|nr:hypothetical protein Poli38472_012664 [Pythium oligandrum]|eukprot:TMW61473.1 hypothetical protein Poli38472_012664 [Pythium oligandrum]
MRRLRHASSNESDDGHKVRTASECPSFLDASQDPIIRFDWDGVQPIDLELMRVKSQLHTVVVHWTQESLGITFGIEEVSRRVVVTRTSRPDVPVGYVLVRAMGLDVTEANFDDCLTKLKRAHSISRGIPFEFISPPPPVFVKKCGGALAHCGVDPTFELRFVGEAPIRYLNMEELHHFIRRSPKPLALTFVHRRDSPHYEVLRRAQEVDSSVAAAALAGTAAIGVGLILA